MLYTLTMIGFTVNPETPEETHRKKVLAMVSAMYSEHFNLNIVPSIGNGTVDSTKALGKFTLPLTHGDRIELSFSVVFSSGFASREVEELRKEAKQVLTDYVTIHIDEIKNDIKNVIAELQNVNSAITQ